MVPNACNAILPQLKGVVVNELMLAMLHFFSEMRTQEPRIWRSITELWADPSYMPMTPSWRQVARQEEIEWLEAAARKGDITAVAFGLRCMFGRWPSELIRASLQPDFEGRLQEMNGDQYVSGLVEAARAYGIEKHVTLVILYWRDGGAAKLLQDEQFAKYGLLEACSHFSGQPQSVLLQYGIMPADPRGAHDGVGVIEWAAPYLGAYGLDSFFALWPYILGSFQMDLLYSWPASIFAEAYDAKENALEVAHFLVAEGIGFAEGQTVRWDLFREYEAAQGERERALAHEISTAIAGLQENYESIAAEDGVDELDDSYAAHDALSSIVQNEGIARAVEQGYFDDEIVEKWSFTVDEVLDEILRQQHPSGTEGFALMRHWLTSDQWSHTNGRAFAVDHDGWLIGVDENVAVDEVVETPFVLATTIFVGVASVSSLEQLDELIDTDLVNSPDDMRIDPTSFEDAPLPIQKAATIYWAPSWSLHGPRDTLGLYKLPVKACDVEIFV